MIVATACAGPNLIFGKLPPLPNVRFPKKISRSSASKSLIMSTGADTEFWPVIMYSSLVLLKSSSPEEIEYKKKVFEVNLLLVTMVINSSIILGKHGLCSNE